MTPEIERVVNLAKSGKSVKEIVRQTGYDKTFIRCVFFDVLNGKY